MPRAHSAKKISKGGIERIYRPSCGKGWGTVHVLPQGQTLLSNGWRCGSHHMTAVIWVLGPESSPGGWYESERSIRNRYSIKKSDQPTDTPPWDAKLVGSIYGRENPLQCANFDVYMSVLVKENMEWVSATVGMNISRISALTLPWRYPGHDAMTFPRTFRRSECGSRACVVRYQMAHDDNQSFRSNSLIDSTQTGL